MPYVLRKALGKDKYWVVNAETKKKYSKDPLPKARAEAQRRALYASERRGGADDYDVKTPPIPLEASPLDPQIKRLLLRMRDATSPRATTTFQGFPGLFDDDVMEDDALLDRIMELFEWADFPRGRFYIVDVLDEMVRGINTARGMGGGAEPKVDEFGNTKGQPAVKGHKSVLKNNADFLKAIEEEAQELFKQQVESFKEATTLLENQKDKLEGRKDVIEQNRLEEASKIGSGIPKENLAALLTLYSKKGKGKFSIKKLNRFLKNQLKGGKLKPCPEGYSDNKAGLCVENCKEDEQDIGLLCKKKCPPNTTDTGIECIEEGCPPNYESTLLTCYKGPGGGQCEGGECSGGEVIVKESWYEPIRCEGDPWKPIWQAGHQVCRGGEVHLRGCPAGYIDDGLLCRKPISCNPIRCAKIIPADSILKRRFARATRGKRMESNIDLRGTIAEIEDGLGFTFEALGEEFAKKFDPEKNGVGAAFRKFGADTKAAFEEIGKNIEDNFVKFMNENPALRDGLAKFGNTIKDLWEASGAAATIGNEEWWKKTMSDPRTYITIVGLIAAGAATVLSAGTLGPASVAAVMALNAVGPAMNIIADAAEGKPIDALDFVMLGLALVPIPGAAGASGTAAKMITENAALGLRAAQALPYVARAAQVGQLVVTGVKVAQTFGYIPSTIVINKPPPPNYGPGSKTGCDRENMRWKLGYKKIADDADGKQTGADLFTTSGCKKPNCNRDDWLAGNSEAQPPIIHGCQKGEEATTDPEELYKRATWAWELGRKDYMRAKPDDADYETYRKAYHLDPKDFPAGFSGWTSQYPEPNCFYPNMITKESRRCLTEAEQGIENEEDEPAVRDPCYVLGSNTSDYKFSFDPTESDATADPTEDEDGGYKFNFAPTDGDEEDTTEEDGGYNFNFAPIDEMEGGADEEDTTEEDGGYNFNFAPIDGEEEDTTEDTGYNFNFAPTDGEDTTEDTGYNFNFATDDETKTCQPDSGIVNSDEMMFGNYPFETFAESGENQEERAQRARVRQETLLNEARMMEQNKQEEFYLLDYLRLQYNFNELLTSSITPQDFKVFLQEQSNEGGEVKMTEELIASMVTPELLAKNVEFYDVIEPPSNYMKRMQEVSNLFSGNRSFTDDEKRKIGFGRLYYEKIYNANKYANAYLGLDTNFYDDYGFHITETDEEFKAIIKKRQERSSQVLPEFNERANQFMIDHKMVENAMEVQRRSDEELRMKLEAEEQAKRDAEEQERVDEEQKRIDEENRIKAEDDAFWAQRNKEIEDIIQQQNQIGIKTVGLGLPRRKSSRRRK